MFSRKSTPPTSARTSKNKSILPHTILGADTHFKGTLKFEGHVRVEGTLEGEIETSDTCVMGRDARVIGTVKVGTLIVHGAIRGDVLVKDLLELHPTAQVRGNIKAGQMVVHAGAHIVGDVDMRSETLMKSLASERGATAADHEAQPHGASDARDANGMNALEAARQKMPNASKKHKSTSKHGRGAAKAGPDASSEATSHAHESSNGVNVPRASA